MHLDLKQQSLLLIYQAKLFSCLSEILIVTAFIHTKTVNFIKVWQGQTTVTMLVSTSCKCKYQFDLLIPSGDKAKNCPVLTTI